MLSCQPVRNRAAASGRDVLDLTVTVTVDHDVVDGAPAARFGAALREILQTAAVLTDPPGPGSAIHDHRETAP